jgi:3-phosphoshikimate 1-carboxyvinyltransferase
VSTDAPNEFRVTGPRPLRGTLRPPGDKGISHRGLLFASIADGASTLRHVAGGEDVARTAAALRALGVGVDTEARTARVAGRGVDAFVEPAQVLDCGNSGTTMRMLAGLVAGRPFLSVLTGDDSLVSRPMARVADPLRAMGAAVDGRAGGTLAPLVVRGGALRGVDHRLAVASGQVKTALVLAGLQAEGTTTITEPAPSRDHTERMLTALGAPVVRVSDTVLEVASGAPRPFDLTIPGDPSSAAFWAVAAAVTSGSDILIEGVSLNPTRVRYLDVLRRMGAVVDVDARGDALGEPWGDVRVAAAALHGTVIDADEGLIDEIPALAVAAAYASGVTQIRGAAELRVKESDRIATVTAMLHELGVEAEATADGFVVRGGHPHPGRVDSAGDHRIAMAGVIAANAVSGESVVTGCTAVATSYPEFFADFERLTAGSA